MNDRRPSVLGLALIAFLDAVPALRPRLWRWWYDALAQRDQSGDLLLMNFGYDNGHPLTLSQAQEAYRYPLQLYAHVASPTQMTGQQVLEVGCGRGGGAAYLAQTQHPASYLGIDLSPQAVALSSAQHHVPGLTFAQGRADALPCADASMDVVLNVESSHCYPSIPDFLREVRRVLRRDGRFGYCDMRSVASWEKTRQAFDAAGLKILEVDCINEPVLRALDRIAAQRVQRIDSQVPRIWQHMFRDFIGVQGGTLYRLLKNDKLRYMRILAAPHP